MGYMHIDNLYKDQRVLQFKQVYCLEKIHGTSAHISFGPGGIKSFFSGGMSHNLFLSIFDQNDLQERALKVGFFPMVVYGEAYGGREQGMSLTYGTVPKFVVFDVKIEERWLNVPEAHKIASDLGLEFVHYTIQLSDLDCLDKEKETPSVQSERNGVGSKDNPKKREGIVIRPIFECCDCYGNRIMAKHKNDDFRETKTPRNVGDAVILEGVNEIVSEYVTMMRLHHVLDKIPGALERGMEALKDIISGMQEDVIREGSKEMFFENAKKQKAVERAIGKETVKLFKMLLQAKMEENRGKA